VVSAHPPHTPPRPRQERETTRGDRARELGIMRKLSGSDFPIPSAPPPLPYKVDTSRPSLRTNWTRLVQLGAAAIGGVGAAGARRNAAGEQGGRDRRAGRLGQLSAARGVDGGAGPSERISTGGGTRRVRLVREEGRDVSG